MKNWKPRYFDPSRLTISKAKNEEGKLSDTIFFCTAGYREFEFSQEDIAETL